MLSSHYNGSMFFVVNNEASCFPSLTPDVCGMSSMSPIINIHSLQTYDYMCKLVEKCYSSDF